MLVAALAFAAAVSPSGAFAIGYPSAAPATRYLHSPGSGGAAVVPAVASQDLRSPDARDAGRAAEVAAVQDLRSPDTRDAAASVARTESANVSPTQTALPEVTTRSISDTFDWGDAGLGAAGMLALVALAGGAALFVSRGRQRARTT